MGVRLTLIPDMKSVFDQDLDTFLDFQEVTLRIRYVIEIL